MDIEDVEKEYGMDIALDNIIELIAKKMNEYIETRDTGVQQELSALLEDKNKIYNNDEETIKKYLKTGRA